jgi:hypothetical protein
MVTAGVVLIIVGMPFGRAVRTSTASVLVLF